jgi:hypothetical protein
VHESLDWHSPHDDKLYQKVCKAHDALVSLSMEAHYLGCTGAFQETRE